VANRANAAFTRTSKRRGPLCLGEDRPGAELVPAKAGHAEACGARERADPSVANPHGVVEGSHCRGGGVTLTEEFVQNTRHPLTSRPRPE